MDENRYVCVFDLDGTLFLRDSTRMIVDHASKYNLVTVLILFFMVKNPIIKRFSIVIRKLTHADLHRYFQLLIIQKLVHENFFITLAVLYELMLEGLKRRRNVWKLMFNHVSVNVIILILSKTLIPKNVLARLFIRFLKTNIIVITEGRREIALYNALDKEQVVILLKKHKLKPLLYVSDDHNEISLMRKHSQVVIWVR